MIVYLDAPRCEQENELTHKQRYDGSKTTSVLCVMCTIQLWRMSHLVRPVAAHMGLKGAAQFSQLGSCSLPHVRAQPPLYRPRRARG